MLEKFMSRKLLVLVAFAIAALVDSALAQEIMPAVMAYIVGQGIADSKLLK